MKPSITIAFCDKDHDFVRDLKEKMSESGFTVIQVDDKETLLSVIKEKKIKLALINLQQNDSDGIMICQEVRNDAEIEQPFIIVYSDKNEDFVQITAFNSGADDFIIKPIKPIILVARIKALMRRSTFKTKNEGQTIYKNNFIIDKEQFKVIKNNKSISLTKKEFELINLFYSTPNKVFTREEIATKLWNDVSVAQARTIDIHVRNIRKRLGKESIKTLKGIGYCVP